MFTSTGDEWVDCEGGGGVQLQPTEFPSLFYHLQKYKVLSKSIIRVCTF